MWYFMGNLLHIYFFLQKIYELESYNYKPSNETFHIELAFQDTILVPFITGCEMLFQI